MQGYDSGLLQEGNGSGEPAAIAGFGTKDRKIPLNSSGKSPVIQVILGEALFCRKDREITVLTATNVGLTTGTEEL